ncbi:hypothetical protein JCM10908_006216 [Rhodotorula pacifica]|uniref:uncharacterized protein n=1 Tax=Rhodotorula pacifica TaxID=1495444 RepID=UPI00316CF958
MRHRGQTRPSWALWALLGLGGLQGGRNDDARPQGAGWPGVVGVVGQSTVTTGRWGQASALLSPDDTPTLVVISGKVPVSGQTIDSTPATSAALTLDLSEPIPNLSSPTWTPFPSSGSAPIAANGALVPLSSSSALFFGGDASSDPAIALPTGNDSSWLLSYPASTSVSSTTAWTHETQTLWPNQPQRRENVYTASASNGTVSRSWIFGGLRPDGSGTAFSELYELQTVMDADEGVASTPSWGMWQGNGGPPAMYDGTAVLLPSSSSSPSAMPSIFLIGGVESAQGGAATLSDLSTAWIFEPGNKLASGTWQKIKLANAPQDRRGHVAVPFGTGAIWIQGGRSLDGTTVYSDSAVLDVNKRRWTTTSSGQAVWGHSAVAVGETILLAFGYGKNAPVSPNLSVYAPGNDTWLDAYYPSYLTVVTNPKAAGTAANTIGTSTAVVAASTTEGAAGTAAARPVSADSATASARQQPTETGTAATTFRAPQWTAPGVALPTNIPTEAPSGSGGSSTSDHNDSGGGGGGGKPPPASVIAGAVVGSILGALVLGVGGVIAIKRQRDHTVYSRRAYTGDDDFAHGASGFGGGSGLMAEYRQDAGYASSEAYNLGKTLPNPASMRGAGGVGAFGAMAALLSPRKRNPADESPARTRRLNMLDEEEAVDDAWTDVGFANQGWTRFGDEIDDARVGALTPTPGEIGILSLKGRGGMGVWDGFGGISRIGDTIRSSKSFLGGALGGFAGSAEKRGFSEEHADEDEKHAGTAYGDEADEKGAQGRHAYGSVAPLEPHAEDEDPSLTPIAEWEEDDARFAEAGGLRSVESGETYSALSHTGPSSSSHRTLSTRPNSTEVTPTKGSARIVRPFSPASGSNASLYGSTFAPPSRFAAPAADLNRAPSDTSHLSQRVLTRSNSSWWSRLNLQKSHHHGEVPTRTAADAIRDPAPAPMMDAIAEADPFLDPAPATGAPLEVPQRRGSTPRGTLDEHGRFADPNGRFARRVHDRTASSNTSEATATSSVLEDRLRNMDVVQRVQSGSASGQSSAETTPTVGVHAGGGFSMLPNTSEGDPFADQALGAAPIARRDGSHHPKQPPPRPAVTSSAQTPGYVYQSPARKIRLPAAPTILPPTPAYAPPDSPRKRLAGPRPEPLSPASGSAFALPRSNSVKNIIASIEKRGSQSDLVGVASAEKATSRNKIVHGFAKKPKLYVANPDTD